MSGVRFDAQQSAQLGLRNSFADLNRDAAVIASGAIGSNDLTAALLHLPQDKLQAQLAARVLSTASDMLGTLLDVHA